MDFKTLERYLRANLLGPGPRLIKKECTGPAGGLTKVEKHWCMGYNLATLVYGTQSGNTGVWDTIWQHWCMG
jgi:hypothetical protein